MFSCDEGRRELQKNAGYERLLVVLLSRELEFSSLDEVKAELSTKVLELAPPDVQKQVMLPSSKCTDFQLLIGLLSERNGWNLMPSEKWHGV